MPCVVIPSLRSRQYTCRWVLRGSCLWVCREVGMFRVGGSPKVASIQCQPACVLATAGEGELSLRRKLCLSKHTG